MTDCAPDVSGGLSLEELQHWTWVLGRAQQMLLEFWVTQASANAGAPPLPGSVADTLAKSAGLPEQMAGLVEAQQRFWADNLALWKRMIAPDAEKATDAAADRDPRFADPLWHENPIADLIRQSYLLISEQLFAGVEAVAGIDEEAGKRLRFLTRQFVEAMSPANFIATSPLIWQKVIETRGESLLKGLEHMLADLAHGQLTQSKPGAFKIGRDIATTPGKVIKETPLYQLIQYTPATGMVLGTPVVIFPPWINRFYILDLGPKKSFVRWAVEQGLTVFVVSWKSADASLVDITLEDYVFAQRTVIDTVRALLDVPAVHAIGYCVAGTTLAATLALLAARGEGGKVVTATFFAAQVDFSRAGDLKFFADDAQLALIDRLTAECGYLDGRYMALTFNMLRGRDLIWNYVVNNYLLGKDYAPLDLLHWNADYTNLPARWHRAYLQDFYRDNKLVQPGALIVDSTPIDLGRIETPSYVQAGREDHIAPPDSVWKLTDNFAGPVRFVLAGSGHIAGVINPPAAKRYSYWTNEAPGESLASFIDGATETAGSWWTDWLAWITARSTPAVMAQGARIPGGGALAAIEDAPGRYVRMR
jgi:polyhydroxyalkanoate synthase